MKRTLEILAVGLLAAGMMTGCPKKKNPPPQTATQTNAAQPETAKQTAEQKPAQTANQTAAQAAPVNEENYLKAMFEVSCVRAKVSDTEKQKAIIAEIYPRYGFTEESFAKAQAAMKDNETIKVSLQKKMTDECTPELAMKLGKAGAEGTTGKEEANTDTKKPKAAAKAWKSGSFNDRSVTGGGFSKASIRVNVNSSGKVMGEFKGVREGKGFMIPFKGEIGKTGTFTASGNRGPNTARITGRYNKGELHGSVQGAVNKKGYRVNFGAK